MIESVTITNHLGESVTMELRFPEKSGFLIRDIQGLDPSKADIDITEIASMDGSIYNSGRVNSRNIVFTLGFLENSTIEESRHLCYQYFPLKRRITIEIVTDARTCQTYGYVESNQISIFSDQQTAVISVICPDAYLYNVDNAYTSFATVYPAFEFPFSNESLTEKLLIMGDIVLLHYKNVSYSGDAAVGIVIYLYALGYIENITISKPDTDESITINTDIVEDITGSSISVGDVIIISTVKGDKYAKLLRGIVEYNILNALNKYPDWFEIEPGDNYFSYDADVGLANIQMLIENRVAYEGI